VDEKLSASADSVSESGRLRVSRREATTEQESLWGRQNFKNSGQWRVVSAYVDASEILPSFRQRSAPQLLPVAGHHSPAL